MASRNNIVLALENEPVCVVSSFADIAETLGRKSQDGLQLWLDLGNLFEAEGNNLSRLTEIVPHAVYVQVKDYCRRDGGKAFCPAGQGEVPYAEMLRVLFAVGRPRTIAVETHVLDEPAQAIRQSVEFLGKAIGSLG
jgi:sugar phosphate isomerase/epimerase